MFVIINKYLLLLLIFVPVFAFSQNVQYFPATPTPPDTAKNDSLNFISPDSLKDYQIIYEYDTIYQTKTIIDHDTIVLIDTLEKKILSDTLKMLPLDRSITILPDTEKTKHFSLGLHFSSFISSDNLSFKNQSANNYVNYRKTYETPLTSYSFALTPEYSFNKWNIKSGLQYSLLRNKYNYPFQLEKYITTTYVHDSIYMELQNDTIDSYFQISGTDTTWFYVIRQKWVTVHDSSTQTIVDTTKEDRIKNGIQYCHFIEIPLVFGYKFFTHKKLSLQINTGIVAAFLIYRKGEIISYNGAQKFINLSDYPFVADFFSGYLGFGINYEISKKINFEIHPYYQKCFYSILQKDFPISQIPDKKGVCIGFQFQF